MTVEGMDVESQEKQPYVAGSNAVDVTPNQDGGILKEIITEGTGEKTPANGNKIFVHYVGTLTDGTKFDSSRDRGTPFEFILGKGSVIKSWDIGVATMKKGEKSVFTCKSEYAYGSSGSPPKIPPDATLIFEIELLDWQGEDLSPKKDGGIIREQIVKGEGYSTPNDGALVEVHIIGRHDGREFENRDVKFTIGEGDEEGIFPGLERALEKFKKGEKSLLKMKPQYAFKDKGHAEYNIPPNAEVEYEVELKNFEKAKESWELDCDGKLEQAGLFKEKGTNYFKAGKIDKALKQYKKIIKFIEHETGFEGDKNTERRAVLLATHLNLAMCYLKLDECVEARDQCNKALEIDSQNVKGLFRRGQALLNIGEPELGRKDFEEVLKIEPNNKAAANQIILCAKKIKEQKQNEKKIYANMFEKFAERDKQKEEAERKKQPDVMKTLGEWGEDEREREMSEFERENPNILLLPNNSGDFKDL
ncbi:peptidyl-prolyl cis-trans isomerase FKBP4 isoform X2 [Ischnura elegans]|nr:peptidyl-prolyl cis-trans isomerase FKBP4 isoform X2 [Ischnura elegans]XP_046394112.1 peptidyl-prolyl cis-trans isomerase FKBP4 isoform X2 [Ischnura elegans]XP_046394113.1 peptidyl-prolyl cis-trans isomerase FKBP4 isoform X2 [Ischnura elegans]XP_046394114.1 peptidyl-prolyl cis-trans isomerase FKBP4 isoform X2 [Ischnura elegans]